MEERTYDPYNSKGLVKIYNSVYFHSPVSLSSLYFHIREISELSAGQIFGPTFPTLYLRNNSKYRDGTKCNLHFVPWGREKSLVTSPFDSIFKSQAMSHSILCSLRDPYIVNASLLVMILFLISKC